MLTTPLLQIKNLSISFTRQGSKTLAVNDLSFSVQAGECVALVGGSGSGKSVTAMSVLGLTAFNGGKIEQGQLNFHCRDGSRVDLAALPEKQLEALRGDQIALIFQEPMTSLNPVYTIGEQIAEVIRQHRAVSRSSAQQQALALIERVRIPEAATRYHQYPHEISGGMRQRVVIAMALACSPRLLIADEPTTALDVTVQAQILDLVQQLAREDGMSVLFITHDMGVVAQIADRVVVMRHGSKVEENQVAALFSQPQADYTRELLQSVPRLGAMQGFSGPRCFGDTSADRPVSTPQQPLLKVSNLVTRFAVHSGLLRRHTADVHAVENVSFDIARGETLALVGESGCGKSTTGRALLQLIASQSGQIELEGDDLRALSGQQLQQRRRDMQIIFQDPYAALDPRLTAFDQVAEPLRIHQMAQGSALHQQVTSLFDRVGLASEHLQRYPHEFSGGQRQRLCIARALALSPKIIIADEPVSALDVAIQAQIVNLMIELQQELGIAYLFISHDMAVVERISHRVAVMRQGQIVETGPREAIFSRPQHAYTRTLLAAVPQPDPQRRRQQPVDAFRLATPVYPKGYQRLPTQYREVSPGHRVLME